MEYKKEVSEAIELVDVLLAYSKIHMIQYTHIFLKIKLSDCGLVCVMGW